MTSKEYPFTSLSLNTLGEMETELYLEGYPSGHKGAHC